MSELKKEYNEHLARFNKACEFMNKSTTEEALKWKSKFDELCVKMSRCIKEMDKIGEKYSTEELIHGFR